MRKYQTEDAYINLLTIRYTLYHMAILKQRVCEGSIRQPGQVAGDAISIPRWMSPYKPNLRMRSRFWRQFEVLHLHSAMEQQKTRRLSFSLKRPLSERFQAVAEEEISQSKKPYVPDNTWRSTDWAVRTFEQWRNFYNSKQNKSECPRDI